MTRRVPLALLAVALAGCTTPAPVQPSVGVAVSPAGVRMAPRVAADLGGATVGLGLNGGSIGTRVGGIGLGMGF